MELTKLQELFPTATLETWHQHKNGGGWVENTAYVANSAYVGPNAVVCGSAQVRGSAQVCGSAQVRDSAVVCGGARVCGSAQVRGTAQVCGSAVVCGGSVKETVPTYSAKYTANPAKPGHLRIGCEVRTYDEWRNHGLSIAKAHGEGEWYALEIAPVLEHLIGQSQRLFAGQE